MRIEAPDDLPSFTHTRRVAISRLGFIALIQHGLILTLDIRLAKPTRRTSAGTSDQWY